MNTFFPYNKPITITIASIVLSFAVGVATTDASVITAQLATGTDVFIAQNGAGINGGDGFQYSEQTITTVESSTVNTIKLCLLIYDTNFGPANQMRAFIREAASTDSFDISSPIIATSTNFRTVSEAPLFNTFPYPFTGCNVLGFNFASTTLNAGTYWIGIYSNSSLGAELKISMMGANTDAYLAGRQQSNAERDLYFVVEGATPPPLPSEATLSSLQQYRSDATTPIPEIGAVPESTVIFNATVSSPTSTQVKLEIEYTTSTFSGIPNASSSFVVPGSVALITVNAMEDDAYLWRARAKDTDGNISGWQEFGTPGNVDFEVKVPSDEVILSQNLDTQTFVPFSEIQCEQAITPSTAVTTGKLSRVIFGLNNFSGSGSDDVVASALSVVNASGTTIAHETSTDYFAQNQIFPNPFG